MVIQEIVKDLLLIVKRLMEQKETKGKDNLSMKLSRNFSLSELTLNQTQLLVLGIDNNPNADQIEKLKLLCENIFTTSKRSFW